MLTLRAEKEASGIYECVAFNGIGNAKRTRAWVQIKRKFALINYTLQYVDTNIISCLRFIDLNVVVSLKCHIAKHNDCLV